MPARTKRIALSVEDRAVLDSVLARPTSTAREYVRAKTLVLKAAGWTNAEVADKLDVSCRTANY